MFPHHSPDNYRGRECHLGGVSSTEDDSARSAVRLGARVSVLHLTPVRHTFTNIHTHTRGELLHTLGIAPALPKVNHMCPHNTRALDFSLVPADFPSPKNPRKSIMKLLLWTWASKMQTPEYLTLACALPVIAELLVLHVGFKKGPKCSL